MQETDSTRIDTVLSVGQGIIKEPMREAIREVLAEEREREDKGRRVPLVGGDERGGQRQQSSSGRRLLGFVAGLAILSYLVRKRDSLDQLRSRSGTAGTPNTTTGEMTHESSEPAAGTSAE